MLKTTDSTRFGFGITDPRRQSRITHQSSFGSARGHDVQLIDESGRR